METYSLSGLTKKLIDSKIALLSSQTLRAILKIENERTFFRIVGDFLKNGILTKIERDKYQLVGASTKSFEMANFLYQPSYISLETALNYWGILSQFPFEITSVSSRKSVSKRIEEKTFSYSHVSLKYFGMFMKENNVLIALPEKALFDQIYMASKGLKTVNFDEYDLTKINKNSFWDICRQLKADKNIINLANKLRK